MKLYLNKLFVASILLISSLDAFANWSYVSKSHAGDEFYIDASTIKKVGDLSRAWFLNQSKLVADGVYSAKILVEFDCINVRSRFLQATMFSGFMGRGSIVHSDDSVTSWSYVSPGSINMTLYRIVCGVQ